MKNQNRNLSVLLVVVLAAILFSTIWGSSEGQVAKAAPPAQITTTLLSEGFEGSFPPSGWFTEAVTGTSVFGHNLPIPYIPPVEAHIAVDTNLAYFNYLPLVQKSGSQITPTATLTPTPTTIPTATPTTPAPSGPKLGSWRFTSVAFPPNTFPSGGFDVTSNGVSDVYLSWEASVAPYCYYSVHAAGPFIINNNSFSFSAGIEFNGLGTFTSQTSANGTLSVSSSNACGTFNVTNHNWTAIWTGP